jgi:hypothetical protein
MRCVALQGLQWTFDNVVFVDMLLLVQPHNLGGYLAQLRRTTFGPENLISVLFPPNLVSQPASPKMNLIPTPYLCILYSFIGFPLVSS